jgi:ribosome-binding factor A
MSLRLERVRELLKRELGEIIRRELPVNDVGLISVNDVIVASDLHSATVFVGVFGGADKQKRALELLDQNRKRIQGMVANAVILKYTPQLRFVLDESIERGNRVMQILDELEEKDSSHS